MKALAFRNRGENKDAYDLVYCLHRHELGPKGIGDRFCGMLERLMAFSTSLRIT